MRSPKKELARERFLLLIEQVRADHDFSEAAASEWVGVDPTLAHKARGGRRSLESRAMEKIEQKIGLRPEWFTREDLGPNPRWEDFRGPAPTDFFDRVAAHARSIARRDGVDTNEKRIAAMRYALELEATGTIEGAQRVRPKKPTTAD